MKTLIFSLLLLPGCASLQSISQNLAEPELVYVNAQNKSQAQMQADSLACGNEATYRTRARLGGHLNQSYVDMYFYSCMARAGWPREPKKSVVNL